MKNTQIYENNIIRIKN